MTVKEYAEYLLGHFDHDLTVVKAVDYNVITDSMDTDPPIKIRVTRHPDGRVQRSSRQDRGTSDKPNPYGFQDEDAVLL